MKLPELLGLLSGCSEGFLHTVPIWLFGRPVPIRRQNRRSRILQPAEIEAVVDGRASELRLL